MSKNNKPNKSVVSIGVVSLITIFVVLLLTSFSLLILSASKSDTLLSNRTAEAVTNYYAADSVAEEVIAELDALRLNQESEDLLKERVLNMGYSISMDPDYEGYEGIVVNFIVDIDDNKQLHVDVGLPSNHEKKVERLRWQTQTIIEEVGL